MGVTARPPTVRLRRLASELKRARKAAGLSQDDVTAQTRISPATLYRIEKPEGRPQMRTLMTLLDIYEVGDSQRTRIMALHEGADTQGWLRPYHDALRDEYNTPTSGSKRRRRPSATGRRCTSPASSRPRTTPMPSSRGTCPMPRRTTSDSG
ncbi:helix-turn-helix domain-containing protein [Streptomyces tauricus]|uniref:helix-turn-helix domain-containing protein n=1 Tax=Streptomyces tauricus TaxID=68274 RepID=UPI00387EEF95